jgi:1-aminocyclopropane-1-carboxylate deaminase/D-cysteine desulfhydrase-like pyridoxal-dependent ACC family enzyme
LSEVAASLAAQGHRPYVVPYGGSNAVGAMGYVTAMDELSAQLAAARQRVDAIVFASSSGGTHAGLVVGARAVGFTAPIIGVRIDKGGAADAPYETQLADLAGQTARHMGLDAAFAPGDFVVNYDYLGGGYGVVGDLEREAIGLMAQSEGILLDPVYTGRAFGGLVDMIRRRLFSARDTILFWHTGGAPALFAYAAELCDI